VLQLDRCDIKLSAAGAAFPTESENSETTLTVRFRRGKSVREDRALYIAVYSHQLLPTVLTNGYRLLQTHFSEVSPVAMLDVHCAEQIHYWNNAHFDGVRCNTYHECLVLLIHY
jgi:hypothetical protein